MQAHGSMALRSFTAPVRAFRAAPAVFRCVAVRPVAALQSSFLGTPCSVRSICNSFTGLSLAPARRPGTVAPRGPVKIEANSKTCIGCTKRGTRRRAARTSGFKARMQTPAGRKVLQARRKKGRKVLCPCSLYKKK